MTLNDSSMVATPTRSSAAPGEGRVESVWAETRMALALEASVPSDRRTMTLPMDWYFFQTILSMKSRARSGQLDGVGGGRAGESPPKRCSPEPIYFGGEKRGAGQLYSSPKPEQDQLT